MRSAFRLEVSEYSDSLINKIDLKAETLLTDQTMDEAQRTLINDKRKAFIDEIKRVELDNLNHLETLNPSEIKKSDVFRNVCFTVDRDDLNLSKLYELSRVDAIFGFLIVLDSYLSNEDVDLYRQLLKFNGNADNLDYENKFFNLIEKEKSSSLEVKHGVFSKKGDFIIKTSAHELFRLNEITLNEFMIDSIKPEAVFLFANIKRINFYYYITNPGKLKNVITSIQLFEKANVERIDFISLKILTYAHSGSIDLCSFNELTNLKELILNTNKITFE